MNEFIIIIYFGFKDHLIETFSLEKICRLWEAALAAGSSEIADSQFRNLEPIVWQLKSTREGG